MLVVALALDPDAVVAPIGSDLERAVHKPGTLATAAVAAAPVWLLLTPFLTLAWMLHRNRRDLLRGGAAEQRARDAIGPIDLLRITRARKREHAAGPLTHDGVLLGHDPRGMPVRIPQLIAHATIVGGSNSGKTNTAEVLL